MACELRSRVGSDKEINITPMNWMNETRRLGESAREEFRPLSKSEAKSIPRLLARKSRTLVVDSIDNGEMDDPACDASANSELAKIYNFYNSANRRTIASFRDQQLNNRPRPIVSLVAILLLFCSVLLAVPEFGTTSPWHFCSENFRLTCALKSPRPPPEPEASRRGCPARDQA
jgi:hypothetical protein